ncbi:hypothetical protein IMZ38_02305 [Thermosphaera chiliense]|uniref:Uncharacterized protein n=1 Tax=Thermosphaera chiliense TaxID=3402707 RepID=A0A7M1UR93_9CREN|nr:hypothetical protein [Thermosphaera aggregans]QOR94778.1 hypothetical protein IMZ38_02305 [Thermosphaera aggregans]
MVSLASTNVYFLQEVSAVLLLAILAFILLAGVKGWRRYVVTWLSLVLIILHYTVISIISKYAKVTVLPLIVVEHDSYGGSLYVDYGQLAILTILIVWRREIYERIKKIANKLRAGRGGLESSQTGGVGEGLAEEKS